MNTENNIEILNDVTGKLIDSCKGYQMCAEIADENPVLKNQFIQRQNERLNLVSEFQTKITALGGKYEDSGTLSGTLHRGYTKFISVFRDDTKAAIDALDTGEEHLAEYIKSKQEDNTLSMESKTLLSKAYVSAFEGERFADRLDD